MKTYARHALLGALALVGISACSDLPTAVQMPTEAKVSAAFEFAPMAVADPIVNGSFETGDFTGWTLSGPGDPAWQVSAAGAGGDNGMGLTAPQDGSFDAWNTFNAAGPTNFTMYQDIALPSDNVELSWKYRAQWTSAFFDNTPRSADFEIRDPVTNEVLATLHHFDTGPIDAPSSGDSGWLTITAPFAGTAGQTVRIFVNVHVEDFFPGSGQFEVDAFAMTALDPPTDPPTEPPPDGEPGAHPETKSDCMQGGWNDFGFKNQGQCVRYVETGKDSR